MEKNNISESIRDLMAKLLSDGLTPHYEEVLFYIDNFSSHQDIKYLIYTINYLKENTLLLNLKIQEYELNSIIQYLSNNNQKNSLPKKEKTLTCIDAADPKEKEFYEVPKELIGKIKIINIDYPEPGLLKIYYEKTHEKKPNGEKYEYFREMTFNSEGIITEVSAPTIKLVKKSEDNKNKEDSIYKGIVGELFDDLLKEETK